MPTINQLVRKAALRNSEEQSPALGLPTASRRVHSRVHDDAEEANSALQS